MKKLFCLILLFFALGSPDGARAEVTHIFKIGEDVTVDSGTHVKSVTTINGQITVSGKVEGNVIALGGSVVLTKTAVVEGNVISLGGIIVQAKMAEINGTVTEINSSNLSDVITTLLSDEWEGWSWIQAIFSITLFLCTLIIGLILVVLLPSHVVTVTWAIQAHTWKATWWGILGLILVVPLMVLLAISVIGIVLIPLELILVVCAGFMGLIAVARLVGRKAYEIFKKSDQHMLRETFWGLVIIWLIGWIPPIGWMIKVFAITIGLGAVIYTRFGTARHGSPRPE